MGSDAPVKLKVKRGTKFFKIFKAFYTNKGIAEKTVKCECGRLPSSPLCGFQPYTPPSPPHPHNHDAQHTPFCFCWMAHAVSFNGTVLGDEDTPDEMEMEDGDQIDAMVQQTGGC